MAQKAWLTPQEADRIPTPALICSPKVIKENIRRMVDMAGDRNRLWVHIKTIKSPHIVSLLREAGIRHFKCATYAEAEMAGDCECENVLWAYPLVGPNIRLLLDLQRRFPQTNWFGLSDNPGQIDVIGQTANRAGQEIRLMMDVDLGQHRTGITPDALPDLCHAAMKTQGVSLQGVHAYDGHVHASGLMERQAMTDAEHERLDPIVQALRAQGMPLKWIIWGGTPTFPCHAKYPGACLSPGTCVLHDAGYGRRFPDLPFEAAAMVLTRVISHPAPNLFTTDLGYKALASDPDQPRARLLGYEHALSVLQNEEHWTLRLPNGQQLPPIGQVLYAIPVHICPTVNLYSCYLAVNNGTVDARWAIPGRDRRTMPIMNEDTD